MKNPFLIFFLFVSISIISQNTLRGRVTGKDNTPLEGVNIYFDGTTISTISDANGNYALQYEPSSNGILVVSFVGYEREYLTSIDASKSLDIRMKISKNELREVVINKNDLFTRKQKLKLFKEYFLGTTKNAKSTIIKNEDDIHFKYDKKKLLLTASSDKPLSIVNTSLGYRIDYELVGFEITFNKISIDSKDVVNNFYQGVSRFIEIEHSPEILGRRQKAFEGSQLQFFRNFARNNWGSDKFLLTNDSNSLDSTKRFKITNENDAVKVEVLRQPKGESKNEENLQNIVASYNLIYNNTETSKIVFQTNSFYIYKYGNNSNIDSILFLGKITEKKVADMLPLNYGIESL
ncbi:hypothetical protein CFS9_36470 [Flavobacterium sp. CFS9]|uniref:CarboxypepD_reg-like domain-containing protein n=1 Tax=Flavobacterium sp. CFS9 TaxID=3143118 RepID=A0AAT9H6N2_9FLAO